MRSNRQTDENGIVHTYWGKWKKGYCCENCNYWLSNKDVLFDEKAKTKLPECPCCKAHMDLDRVNRVKWGK